MRGRDGATEHTAPYCHLERLEHATLIHVLCLILVNGSLVREPTRQSAC